MQGDVLLAQAVLRERRIDESQGLGLFDAKRPAQGFLAAVTQQVGAALEFLRLDQLEPVRVRLVEVAPGVVCAQHVNQLVPLAERVLLWQLAIPLGAGEVADLQRQHGDGFDQIRVGRTVHVQLITLHERRVVAAHIELHRFDDCLAVERHQRRRRDGQRGIAQRRVFGRPDRTASGQLNRELS